MTEEFDKSKFTIEKQGLNYFADSDLVAINIRRIFKLVWIAAGTAFEETFDESTRKGFDFNMTGGSSEVDLNDSLGSIQRLLRSKTSFTFDYKITCDDKSEKYSDLRSRTSRKRFIEKMIQFIQSRALQRRLNIEKMEYKEDGGGKNPRLHIQIKYVYKVASKKKPGVKETKRTNINLNFALKYAGSFSSKLDSLKPKDVKPKVVDVWLTPQQMYDNMKTYIEGSNFPSQNQDTKTDYLNAVTTSFKSLSLTDDLGIAPDLSSEFFEILSCLKLGNLLLNNDNKIKMIFGLPEERINTVQIEIPGSANEALIDYKIAVNGDTSNPLRISVKSKVRGSSVATAKFSDAFKNEKEVDDWFNAIKFANMKTKNIGQKTIAKNAMKYNSYSGKAMLYPIGALVDLCSGAVATSVKADYNKHVDTTSMNFNEFEKVIELLDKRINAIKPDQPLDEIINDATLLLKLKNLLADNTFRYGPGSSAKTKKTKQAVSLSIPEAKKVSYGGVYPFTVKNVSLLCERVLVQTSYLRSSSQFNFYKLFYDQILKKEAVVYSFNEIDDSGDERKLKYHYRSARNFNQYKKWIGLRTKNYGNNLKDTLGMNL